MASGAAVYLYERQRETEVLELALENARAGDGGLVVVLGPAGIGKSRLIAAATDLARARDLDVLAGAGAEPEREFPFGVALQLFERQVQQASAAQRAKLLNGAAGLARPLFGGDPTVVDGTSARLFALVHGLFWLLSNLTERRPLLVAVDDLHWCDQESLQFLLYLAQRISALQALLIVSARPGERSAAEGQREQLIEHPRARVLRPAPLSHAGVRAVSETDLGFAVEEEFVAACAGVTGGNPFFLHELLAALQSDGIDARSAEPERVRGLAPEALTQRLLVRVMRLPEPAPSVARALAILGDRPSLAHAATLAGIGTRVLVELGSALRRANQRSAARQPLTEAHQLAHRGGAILLAERARIELAALGARPRKEPAARDQLTASEHRVAEMATRGMTNKQIAQTLFITVKAVEWHLHHAYQKLDITSRKQLAQALADAA